MPRKVRVSYENACYHITNRGIDKRAIFLYPVHYQLFLTLLEDITQCYNVRILAYCLMSNHYHLMMLTPEANISQAMKHLSAQYTQHFNKLEQRDGPLFKGRYHAKIIQHKAHFANSLRYIHHNPVEANISNCPEAYQWSSAAAYAKKTPAPKWLCHYHELGDILA